MFEHYYRELLNFCTHRLKDRDAAADVVQESFARILAVQKSGQSIPEPRALLHQIAKRVMIDQHRRLELRNHDDIHDLTEADQPAAPAHLQPEEAYSHEQQMQAIVAAIESLPPRCREAFILNRFDGLSHQEIAERMGISKNMVAQHITRALLACKACEEGFEPKPRSPGYLSR